MKYFLGKQIYAGIKMSWNIDVRKHKKENEMKGERVPKGQNARAGGAIRWGEELADWLNIVQIIGKSG